MRREDLLALDADALAALANRGLVKRAEKMLASGQGPLLEVAEEGTVVARDGEVETVLKRGVPLGETRCTCQSVGMCRHRVAAVLAYIAQFGGESPAEEEWSPGEISDEQLQSLLGPRLLAQARSEAARGVVAEVCRGPVPRVALATTSVRFLVAHHLEHARCDCRQGAACVHLALAVWAFRKADRAGAEVQTISLAALEASQGPWEQVAEVVASLLGEGVSYVGSGWHASLVRATQALRSVGWTWPADILQDLKETLELYARRSAAYDGPRVLSLLGELQARRLASRGTGEQPVRVVLGLGEAGESALKHLDLTGLGARLRHLEGVLRAEVFLADPASATVLVMRKEWKQAEVGGGPQVAGRAMAPGVSLGTVAAGQMITGMARRKPNRLLILGRGAGSGTSLSPRMGRWGGLPEPLLVRDFAALRRECWEAPPPQIRPRLLADGVRVLAVAGVGVVSYSRSTQTLSAQLLDSQGESIWLRREFETVAPGALEALVLALGQQVSFVSGRVGVEGGLHVDPLGLALGDGRVLVPDLAESTGVAMPLAEVRESPAPVEETLEHCRLLLSEFCQRGLRHLTPDWQERVRELQGRCQGLGLSSLAESLGVFADSGASPTAWLDCAVLLQLASLCLSG